jgi:hypothetical protein
MRASAVVATAAAGFAGLAAAQFPPKQEGFTTLKSRFHENVTISYKEVSSSGKTRLAYNWSDE